MPPGRRKPKTRKSTASSRGRFDSSGTPVVQQKRSRGGGRTPRGGGRGRTPKGPNPGPRSAPRSQRKKNSNPWEDSGSEDETRRLDFDSDSYFEDESDEDMDSEGMVPSDDEPLISSLKKPRKTREVSPPSWAKKKKEEDEGKKPRGQVVTGLEEEADSDSGEDEEELKLVTYSDEDEEASRGSLDDRFRIPSPIWNLKQCPWVEAENLPKLDLPPSSEDLLVPPHLVFDALEVYEICRRFSQTIKLSPFLFEDFCAALMSKEQSKLLAEIHISLLKLLMKEDDDEKNVVFTPWDMRDSQNITVYLMDSMTYAEVLRQYIHSDRKRFPKGSHTNLMSSLSNMSILNAVTNGNYPFVSPSQRLTVMKWLCARFLQSNSFRKEMKTQGILSHDEHCRDCGKPGELICCDSCSAAYHLSCVVPPLKECPAESEMWFCCICKQHQIKGVFDCLSVIESKGLLIRQESLGFDRHGRRYWFLARRIFVQNEETLEARYYSTLPQLRRVFAKLDELTWEQSLCEALSDLLPEIARQMRITAQLTETQKPTRKSYFQAANEEIMADIEEEMAEIESMKKDDKPPELQLESPQKPGISLTHPPNLRDISKPAFCNGEWKEGEEEMEEKGIFESMQEEMGKDIKALPPPLPQQESMDTRIPKRNNMAELVDRTIQVQGWTDDSFSDKGPESLENRVPPQNRNNPRYPLGPSNRLTPRQKEIGVKSQAQQASMDPSLLFKLGMDANGGYRRYMNRYAINDYAKTPYQRAQERTRNNYMEKKFFISKEQDALFHWPHLTDKKVSEHNTDIHLEQREVNHVITRSLDYFLQRIDDAFWLRSWTAAEKSTFRRRSLTAQGPKQLREQLAQLESSLKPCIFQKSWFENLGHTRLVRQTPVDRQERQKAEKKRKAHQKALLTADPEEQTENLIWIKYTKTGGPPLHQIWKHRDEGFRVNSEGSLGGWMWVSCLRRPHYEDPQWTVPDEFKVSRDSPTLKKKRRLEDLVRGFRDKREEQWTAEVKNRQKEVQTTMCYSPSCRKGLLFPPVAGVTSIAQACYNPSCRKNYAQATHFLPKDTANKVKIVPPSKFHVSPGGKLERQESYGKDIPFPAPQVHTFRAPHTEKRSILVIPSSTQSKIARQGGVKQIEVPGFRWDSKNSPVLWPYPCARPTFHTSWRFMTQTARSLHSVGLQLRILYANIRWEEMKKDHPLEAKLTVHFEDRSEMRDLIDHLEQPPNGVMTKYLLRVVVTPIVKVEETKDDEEDEDWTPTPRRSAGNKGLRERPKKVSRQKDGTPSSLQKKIVRTGAPVRKQWWYNEENLKLWEIKNYWTRYNERKAEEAMDTQEAPAPQRQTQVVPRGVAPPPVRRPGLPQAPNLRYVSPNVLRNSQQGVMAAGSRLRVSNIKQIRAPNYAGGNYVVRTPPLGVRQQQIIAVPPRASPAPHRKFARASQLGLLASGGVQRPPILPKQEFRSPKREPQSVLHPSARDRGVVFRSNSGMGSGSPPYSGDEGDMDDFDDNDSYGSPDKPPTVSKRPWMPPSLNRAGRPPTLGPPKTLAAPTLNARPVLVKRVVTMGNGGRKYIVVQQADHQRTLQSAAQESGKRPQTFAQRPITARQPFGAAAVGPSAVVGARRQPSESPLAGLSASPGKPLAGTSGEGLSAPPLLQGEAVSESNEHGVRYVEEDDGIVRVVRTVGGRPRGPGPARIGSTKGAPPVSSLRPIRPKPAPGSPEDDELYTVGGFRLKGDYGRTSDRLHSDTYEDSFTHGVPPAGGRFQFVADDSESGYKVMEFQKRMGYGAETEEEPEWMRSMESRRSVGGEDQGEEMVDVESPEHYITSTGQPVRYSLAGVPRTSQLGSGRAGRGGKLGLGGSYRISQPQHASRVPQTYRQGNLEQFPLRPPSSRGVPPYGHRMQERNQQYQHYYSRPPPGGRPRMTAAAVQEQRQQKEREKVCRDILKGLVDTVCKCEKEEMKQREKEMKMIKRREYDRIYRARRKYEKEVDYIVQERMQSMRKEVQKRRARIEQDAEAQAKIGVWNLKGAKQQPPPTSAKGGSGTKRKLSDRLLTPFGSGALRSPPTLSTSRVPHPQTGIPSAEKRAKTGGGSAFNDKLSPRKRPTEKDKKKEEFAVCCKAPYDETKFYVKCDLCSDWFHGKCVGLNAKKARKIDSWSCDKCEEEVKKTEEELYCLCRTPYDVAQFYVGCDGCEGWYHPRCVGISQREAESVDQYFCPTCSSRGGRVSAANQQPLTRQDYTRLFEILDCLKENRNSWPFRSPVDPVQFPSYYVMIRDPMDLQSVEQKLNNLDYTKLQDFVADISKIFDNARLFNAKDSAIHQCAVILEKRFDESLVKLKEEMAAAQTRDAEQQAELQRQAEIQEEHQLRMLQQQEEERLRLLEEEGGRVEVDGEAEVEVDVEEVLDDGIIQMTEGELFLGGENIVVVDGDGNQLGPHERHMYNQFIEFENVNMEQ